MTLAGMKRYCCCSLSTVVQRSCRGEKGPEAAVSGRYAPRAPIQVRCTNDIQTRFREWICRGRRQGARGHPGQARTGVASKLKASDIPAAWSCWRLEVICPGREPPDWAVRHPARPYRRAMHKTDLLWEALRPLNRPGPGPSPRRGGSAARAAAMKGFENPHLVELYSTLRCY